MNRVFRFLMLTFLLCMTIMLDVFLFFWERIRKHRIFPGS